jgi:hypothetical protein
MERRGTSMKVDFITVEGILEIQGIFNFNGKDVTKEMNNHLAAKKTVDGIDYTSSRCLRHEMFKDIQPIQPRKSAFKDIDNFYVSLAASEVGILRGIMSMEEGNSSLKRNSPLSVQDAYTTTNKSVIFFDQGTSSKPKEKDNGKKDTSIFSKDNAPKREQELKMFINICGLQFITQDSNDHSIVLEADEDLFLKKIKETFSKIGLHNQEIIISEYQYQSGLDEIKIRGILFNNDQLRALVINSIKRLANICSVKNGSYIKAKDLTIALFEKNEKVSTINLSKENLDSAFEGVTFKEYFKSFK